MKKRLFRQHIGIALITVLISSVLVCFVMYNRFFVQMKEQVKIEAAIVSAGIRIDDRSYLDKAANASPLTRMTIIAEDGSVIYDSRASYEQMENHLNRPEVKQAILHGTGQAQRLSATLGRNTFYYALRLESGDILRIAETTDSVYAALISCLPWMILSMGAVLLTVAVISKKQADAIIAPINLIDLENPMDGKGYDELAPLLVRIAKQREQIEAQMENLAAKQMEFTQISENMSEGLVLLNTAGEVLTINKSAQRILDVNGGENKHIIALCRMNEMQLAVNQAQSGQSSSQIVERQGRIYQIIANPVVKNGSVIGAILLLPDITEQHNSEQMRREFSANVSHELKTPLTSISGYAEMMKNGMVKSEDMSRFSERIYNEAQRLMALVSDIIDLSRLDEQNISVPKVQTDLGEIGRKAGQNIAEIAHKNEIDVEIKCHEAVILGVPQLLERMVNNLCENAVKYNNKGGFVKITTGITGEKCFIEVSDNGIGIPKAQQSRVFERFYRVDSSHSKDTGGTGLGLSIVKHIAMYHGGEIFMESRIDKGTAIRVEFPKK